MHIDAFDYELPENLIAKYPLKNRRDSRLLCVDANSKKITHQYFKDLLTHIQKKDLLIFNNTKVIPARLYGVKLTGGKVEILIERILPDNKCLAHVRSSKKLKPGGEVFLDNNIKIVVCERRDDLFELEYVGDSSLIDIVEKLGHMPLPPYIDRDDEILDQDRYQTVYAEQKGAVAAPTAGLHFDDAMMSQIQQADIEMAFVTLHVGAGTFQPVRVETIEQHHMHAEYIEVSQQVCEKIKACKVRGGRVICVGTTSLRSLESAAQTGEIKPFYGDTDIFIYPSYEFKIVDALITNFHLPKSTLLMLVSAFAGMDVIKDAYQQAISNEYRFFSYGDAMFMSRSIA